MRQLVIFVFLCVMPFLNFVINNCPQVVDQIKVTKLLFDCFQVKGCGPKEGKEMDHYGKIHHKWCLARLELEKPLKKHKNLSKTRVFRNVEDFLGLYGQTLILSSLNSRHCVNQNHFCVYICSIYRSLEEGSVEIFL